MAVDLFSALGVDAPPDNAVPPGVNVRATPTPAADKGIDLFKALGVDRAQSFGPSNPLPDGAKPDARMSVPNTVARTPDLPAWAGGGQQQPREPIPVAPQQKPSLSNIAGAVPSGLYEGLSGVANIPTGVANLASKGIKAATGYDVGQLQPPIETNPTGYHPVGGIAKFVHDASSAAANTAALGGVAKLATPLFPADSAPAALSSALESPSAGTIAAAGIGGGMEEPAAKAVPEEFKPLARIGANLAAGGLTAGATSALGGAARSSISPETAQLAQLGRDTYDIPITAAQMSGNRIVKTADSVLKSIPFSGHGDLDHETQLAVNSAVARTFGEDASKLTPAVMAQARTRIGSVLQDVETRNPVNFDNQTMQDLSRIENDAHSSLTDPEFSVVRRQLDGVMSNVQPGNQIEGNTYGNLMHKGSPLDAAANNKNPNIANYAGEIKDVLRQSLQRSLSGDDAAAYQQARTQWKNMKTVEPLTQSSDVVGGASPSTGDINPTLLRAVVNRSYKDVPYRAMGDIPLNDIADIGQRFLKETGTSHTSERGWLMHLLTGAGAGIFGVEHGLPSAKEAILGAGALGATGGIARGVSGALQSDVLANRMIQQGLTQAPTLRQNLSNAAAPLAAGAVTRQIEEAPQGPTTNPATGLPQFNLEDNQAAAGSGVLDHIADQMTSGALNEPAALKSYVDQNKRAIRKEFGGQGIQNVMLVGALARRPGTAFSAISETPSAAIKQALAEAGATERKGLLTLAMSQPSLAKVLSEKAGSVLSKPLEARIISALQNREKRDAANAGTGDRVGAPRGGVASTRGGIQRSAMGAMADSGKTPMVATQI